MSYMLICGSKSDSKKYLLKNILLCEINTSDVIRRTSRPRTPFSITFTAVRRQATLPSPQKARNSIYLTGTSVSQAEECARTPEGRMRGPRRFSHRPGWPAYRLPRRHRRHGHHEFCLARRGKCRSNELNGEANRRKRLSRRRARRRTREHIHMRHWPQSACEKAEPELSPLLQSSVCCRAKI